MPRSALPPLALLHAFPYDALMWSAQRAALEAHTTVHVLNCPGFGGAPPLRGVKPSLDAYAELLLLQLPGRFIAVGNSLGGYIAQAMLRLARERVAGIVLINSRAIDDDAPRKAQRHQLIDDVRRDGVERFRIDCIKSEPRRTNGTPAPEDLFGSMTAEGVIDGALVLATRPDQRRFLCEIDVPALYLYGVGDPIVPEDEARDIASQMPGAQFIPIPQAAHIAGLDNPAAVNEALIAFLQRFGA